MFANSKFSASNFKVIPQMSKVSQFPQNFKQLVLKNKAKLQATNKQQILQKILSLNKGYYQDKVKVQNVPKPTRHSLRIPTTTGESEYSKNYAHKSQLPSLGKQILKRQENMSLGKKAINNYRSSYSIDYALRDQQQLVNSTKKQAKYSPSQVPIFGQSSYKRDYNSITVVPTFSIKPIPSQMMGGGPMASLSTYKQSYKSQQNKRIPTQPVIHNDHPIFVNLSPQIESIYSSSYQQSQRQQKEASCKPYYRYTPRKGSRKYKTEYNDSYVAQEIVTKKQSTCLNEQQLDRYLKGVQR